MEIHFQSISFRNAKLHCNTIAKSCIQILKALNEHIHERHQLYTSYKTLNLILFCIKHVGANNNQEFCYILQEYIPTYPPTLTLILNVFSLLIITPHLNRQF